eukprot:5032811-Prymnesium_polylepis.1
MTYKPKGQAVSRIDGVWANLALLEWSGARCVPRCATALLTEPLNADHAAVAVRFAGVFTWRRDDQAQQGQPVVAYSACQRPRRCNMTGERAERLRLPSGSPRQATRISTEALLYATQGWADTARALNLLLMPSMELTHATIVQQAARARELDAQRGIDTSVGYDARERQIQAAADNLLSLLQGEQRRDLSTW